MVVLTSAKDFPFLLRMTGWRMEPLSGVEQQTMTRFQQLCYSIYTRAIKEHQLHPYTLHVTPIPACRIGLDSSMPDNGPVLPSRFPVLF